MRAIVLSFLKLDRPVAGEQLAAFDRTQAAMLAVGTHVRLVDGTRLLGGGGFAKPASDRAADVVGPLFDGGEIEVVDRFIGTEEIWGDRFQDFLETRVEFGVRRGRLKHGGPP